MSKKTKKEEVYSSPSFANIFQDSPHLSEQIKELRDNANIVPRMHAYKELLAALWLYIDWKYVTRQLTTEQKEMFADAVDYYHNLEFPEGGPVAERWWRE